MNYIIKTKNDEPSPEHYFTAMCSVCFRAKVPCLPLTYPYIDEIYRDFKVVGAAFLTCDNCRLYKEKKELYYSIKDYFLVHELWRFRAGDKKGIVRTEEEFSSLFDLADEAGTIYIEKENAIKIGNAP